ncbi:heparan sulfate glucosamine 3-O-sulfotransferase 3A1-like [Saccostrea echinata]|uniref:heparan sulfate glucosamine 3-O-sulfotransferase 3A1-like n=1 Tax=Saccostrea echinata TaxID=191078 RepID=UPI002A81EF05|nr:heparan sulfate glucosamine 3-O-sulfotransferase 3A1-like [Saccostrea echinata]
MVPNVIRRITPRKLLQKVIVIIFGLLLFIFGIHVFVTEREPQENTKIKENERFANFGMKSKYRLLHENQPIRNDDDIIYLDDELNNVVEDNKLQEVTSRPMKRLPDALIIGVKKSGTKTMLEFLKIHPDVCAPGNEVHYFTRNYHKGLEWYRRQMPVSVENQVTVERTRAYFVHGEVPHRVYRRIPNIRFIVVVRNPVLRTLLDYISQCERNKSKLSFKEAFFWNNDTGFLDISRDFIQTSIYVKFLDNWLKYFKLDQIHFVNGDKLYKNPLRELKKVEDFLSLRNLISSEHFYYNTSRDTLCIKKRECQGRPHCFSDSKLKIPPPVYLMKRLQDFFDPFNEKFYEKSKQHFNWNA